MRSYRELKHCLTSALALLPLSLSFSRLSHTLSDRPVASENFQECVCVNPQQVYQPVAAISGDIILSEFVRVCVFDKEKTFCRGLKPHMAFRSIIHPSSLVLSLAFSFAPLSPLNLCCLCIALFAQKPCTCIGVISVILSSD